ncbi:hypothetical protein [Pendulispora albinea]|uniref:VapC50 C-terminal domain-containing protein n=1 Tax=Pendulispora albinea TaxID=2741071 RepID=A0ABZ2M5L4_9BACT
MDSMPNDPKDRHVVAAAVMSGAQVIVTANLKDFRPPLPGGIEAQSPDEFLCNVFDFDPATTIERLEQQAEDLTNVPLPKLLDALAKLVPDFVAAVREALPEYAAGEPSAPSTKAT